MNELNDSLILNPKSNRFVKKTSQTGIRLMKELSLIDCKVLQSTTPAPMAPIVNIPQSQPSPVQKVLLDTCLEVVKAQPQAFQGLSPQ